MCNVYNVVLGSLNEWNYLWTMDVYVTILFTKKRLIYIFKIYTEYATLDYAFTLFQKQFISNNKYILFSGILFLYCHQITNLFNNPSIITGIMEQ